MPTTTRDTFKILQVALGERSYPIVIGEGIVNNPKLLQQYITSSQLAFISNETVAPLYLSHLSTACLAKTQINHVVADGEQFKTLETLSHIFDTLLKHRLDRTATLVALGGGVVCDMTGFAAACYRRGIDFIQMPTTLLAQVDAAVGGKTAVNHPLGKNMIGAFYQPKAVLIDVDTLKSLPEREFKAGLAEVLKYAFIQDTEFLDWLLANKALILTKDPKTLIHMIHHCCAIKADIVAQDETEQSIRALLNFGHTFGHALESATQYKTWLHGEAVAIGMAAATYMSCELGLISIKDCEKVIQSLETFALPISQYQHIPTKVLKQYLLQDKKVLQGQLRLILLKSIGHATISTDFNESHLEKALNKM